MKNSPIKIIIRDGYIIKFYKNPTFSPLSRNNWREILTVMFETDNGINQCADVQIVKGESSNLTFFKIRQSIRLLEERLNPLNK